MEQQSAASMVFVIEPDERQATQIVELLQEQGYLTQVHKNAEDLITALDGFEGQGCIVSEMDLPGIGGQEMLSVLEEQGCSLPVIILTWDADVSRAVEALRGSVADYLVKPLVERKIINRLRSILNEPGLSLGETG
jgi:FixJ family two-component response regulator